MRAHDYWCYTLTHKEQTPLYIGVANDLIRRITAHRAGAVPGFTTRHRLKGWKRERKNALIARKNPRWMDLSASWLEEEPPLNDLVRWKEEIDGVCADRLRPGTYSVSSLRSE